ALKSVTDGQWDWDAVVSTFNYNKDELRFPTGALPGSINGGAGTIQSMTDTGWITGDIKGYWRPQGMTGAHQVSFGVHGDQYKLVNTSYSTSAWNTGATGGPISANSLGKTQTYGLWAQDAWRFAPQYKLTLGGRVESWRAYDGFNFSAAPASSVRQPTIGSSDFSPKASLSWAASADWQVTASYGTAYRYPTVSELYQAVTVSGVVYTPNPNLRPERAQSVELAIEHALEKGRVRLSLFQEDLADGLISQNSTIPGTNVVGSSVQNVERILSRGLELVGQQADVGTRGLDLSGSMTFVDSRIRSDPGFRNANGVLTDVSNRYTPNIPRLKMTGLATYRYDEQWSGALGARYSDRVWATIDNTDANPGTYQGFEKFLVFDARLNYQFDKRTRASLGIDNLNNQRYFLFHPFPQRTVIGELKFNL
ncbi:MAG TPA: TonB-dependent receptor, partial [Burkholderiales bacterium]|nr:TonB-dependent receptor [Burkholderiales bacterium]